jgi:hypothetical protein
VMFSSFFAGFANTLQGGFVVLSGIRDWERLFFLSSIHAAVSNFFVNRNLKIVRRMAISAACASFAFWGVTALEAADELAPINIKLPVPHAVGTKTDTPWGPNVDPIQTNRAPFMAPKDVVNLALGKKVTSSYTNADAASLAKIVDGDKTFDSDSIVLLGKGAQWVQVDLGQPAEIFAVALWHAHDADKVYHKVVVQISDKEDFSGDVQTIFNNDADGSIGRGVGKDREYVESFIGKLIDAKGAKARFVRCYSNASTDSKMNEYTEIEVYGRPAK